MSQLTPMMAQYKEIKAHYQDCILLYRLGDFYEMFFDDAEVASKILEITLTARNKKGPGAPIPMCGVPYHALENYLAKLTLAGKKVAICEQVSSANSQGIVKREVTKIVTPGTTFSPGILEQKTNNYLAAISEKNNFFETAFCDLTTGDFFSASFENLSTLLSECAKINPTEILLAENLQHLAPDLRNRLPNVSLNFMAIVFSTETLISYLENTQKTSIKHLAAPEEYSRDQHLLLDDHAIRNLEIFFAYDGKKDGSLLQTIDHTVTAGGGRLLKKALIHPSRSEKIINQRLDAVEVFANDLARLEKTRQLLEQVYDLERLIARLNLGSANGRDLLALKNTLAVVPVLKNLTEFSSLFCDKLDPLHSIHDLIDAAIIDEPSHVINQGAMIKANFHPELAKLKNISEDSRGTLLAIQKREIARTGINNLKIKFNKIFGYYIEISKAAAANVPSDYIRKQTLVNGERFITPELKELEEIVLSADEKIKALELEIFQDIRAQILTHTAIIQQNARTLALIDLLAAFAHLAKQKNYCRPSIADDNILEIIDGRHPVVENLTTTFIPNSTHLGAKNNFQLITGPNMGGKSTYLRQVALITLLAHIGSFVPALSAKIPLTDRIFTRVGAADSLYKGQSTFMVEMIETATILNEATANSLIVLDELGRGTSTYDGLSIASAVTSYLHDRIGAKTIFATHYHELIDLVKSLPRGENLSVGVSEDQAGKVVFLYKIINQAVNKSYGIHVAALAKLPEEVLQNAEKILSDLEKNHRPKPNQLDLFLTERPHKNLDNEKEQLCEAIKVLDLNNLTPMQALEQLQQYQLKLQKP